ncbi:MAG: type I restriction endonuclease subunit R [Elainellaceae cyanobacterium]
MANAIAIGRLTLPEIIEKQGLRLSSDPQFFTEWQVPRPDLSPQERDYLGQVQQDYFDQLRRGTLSEGLIKLVIISPLLHLAGFYRAPYQVRLEEPVQVELTEQNEIWRGRIDALVIQDQLWTVVVESKGSVFGIDQAIPQALGYMFAAPQPERPTYGLVTNGSGYAFVKLLRHPEVLYSISEVFLLLPGAPQEQRSPLQTILSILKKLGQAIDNSPSLTSS